MKNISKEESVSRLATIKYLLDEDNSATPMELRALSTIYGEELNEFNSTESVVENIIFRLKKAADIISEVRNIVTEGKSGIDFTNYDCNPNDKGLIDYKEYIRVEKMREEKRRLSTERTFNGLSKESQAQWIKDGYVPSK